MSVPNVYDGGMFRRGIGQVRAAYERLSALTGTVAPDTVDKEDIYPLFAQLVEGMVAAALGLYNRARSKRWKIPGLLVIFKQTKKRF